MPLTPSKPHFGYPTFFILGRLAGFRDVQNISICTTDPLIFKKVDAHKFSTSCWSCYQLHPSFWNPLLYPRFSQGFVMYKTIASRAGGVSTKIQDIYPSYSTFSKFLDTHHPFPKKRCFSTLVLKNFAPILTLHHPILPFFDTQRQKFSRDSRQHEIASFCRNEPRTIY